MAFDHFSPKALGFLTELKANNSRDWFAAQKPVYEAELKQPAGRFCTAMEEALVSLTGASHSSKIFRIHRDVRFSKDKSPYNAHLHISFVSEESETMWFWGLGVDTLSLGCGIFEFPKDRLARFREDMAGPAGAAFLAMRDTMQAKGLRVGAPDLKRVPQGFDKDHPHGEALRYKGFAVWRDLEREAAARPGIIQTCRDVFAEMMPVRTFFAQKAP